MNAGHAPQIDLGHLLKRIDELSVIGIAQIGPPAMLRKLAVRALENRGVELRRAHRTAVNELVAFEIDRQMATVQMWDNEVERLFHVRTAGRPNKHSALSDFLIFAGQHWLQFGGKLKARDARNRIAKMFGLTSDTKFSRSRLPSVEQVRRAEERTLARLALLQKIRGGDELLNPGWLQAVCVLGLYMSELNDGVTHDPEAFRAAGAWLVCLCRMLDALERLDRIKKNNARKVVKPTMRRASSARPDESVN